LDAIEDDYDSDYESSIIPMNGDNDDDMD
jgi:hypothetical protein